MTEDGWNPVADSVVSDRNVMMAVDQLRQRDVMIGYYRPGSGWVTRWGKPVQGEVTHWMDLPALPQVT